MRLREHHQRHGFAFRQYLRRFDRLSQLQSGAEYGHAQRGDLASRGISCVVVNPGWVKTDMGGPHATLPAQESVGAIRRLIATLSRKDNGKFYHYDGSEYPW